MKTCRVLLLVLLLVISLPAGAVAADGIQVDALATTTTSLNLRAGPGTGEAIRRSIPAGASTMVRSGPTNDVWYAGVFAGVSGYVHSGYLVQ